MRNITLSADKETIDQARELMKAANTSLNEQFKLWLQNYVEETKRAAALESLRSLRGKYAIDKMPTREEMNER